MLSEAAAGLNWVPEVRIFGGGSQYTSSNTVSPMTGPPKRAFRFWGSPILVGSWGLVTTYSWAQNPMQNPIRWAYRGYVNFT